MQTDSGKSNLLIYNRGNCLPQYLEEYHVSRSSIASCVIVVLLSLRSVTKAIKSAPLFRYAIAYETLFFVCLYLNSRAMGLKLLGYRSIILQRCHPACGHEGSLHHLSPVLSFEFLSRCKFVIFIPRQPMLRYYSTRATTDSCLATDGSSSRPPSPRT